MPEAIQNIALSKLIPDPDNINVHGEVNIAQISASIQRFGFLDPIGVVRHPTQRGKFMIVEGHGRHTAATNLGLEELPCIVLELDDAKRRGYAIAHNQTQRIAPLNNEAIAEEFDRLGVERDDYISLGMTEEDAIFTLGAYRTNGTPNPAPFAGEGIDPNHPSEVVTTTGDGEQGRSAASGTDDYSAFIPAVHKTTLRFASEVGYNRFTELLTLLRVRYPLAGTISERVQMFLTDNGLVSEGVEADG